MAVQEQSELRLLTIQALINRSQHEAILKVAHVIKNTHRYPQVLSHASMCSVSAVYIYVADVSSQVLVLCTAACHCRHNLVNVKDLHSLQKLDVIQSTAEVLLLSLIIMRCSLYTLEPIC